MNSALQKLLVVEFRRYWTVTALVTPLLFLVISSLIILLPTPFAQNFDVGNKLHQVLGFLVPVASAFFCVGIVSNDVKDGWLRTLLVRALRREEYVIVKMTSAAISIWTVVVFASAVPLLIGGFASKVTVEFDVVEVLSLTSLYFGASLTYIAILTFVSCWLPGVINVALLMVWGIFASAAHYYVGFALWDSSWAVILEQFIFPSGFFEAIDAVKLNSHAPYSEIVWGVAALGLFLGLTFWSVTKIQVDRGSE